MPYLTDTERKSKLTHLVNYCIFESNMDLSEGVKVSFSHISPSLLKNPQYIQIILVKETAQFMCYWMNFIHPNLNGFPGIDTIKWHIILDSI